MRVRVRLALGTRWLSDELTVNLVKDDTAIQLRVLDQWFLTFLTAGIP